MAERGALCCMLCSPLKATKETQLFGEAVLACLPAWWNGTHWSKAPLQLSRIFELSLSDGKASQLATTTSTLEEKSAC